MEIKPIAYAHTEFKTKFGVPRQSGVAPQLEAIVVFEPDYRQADAFRGLNGYDYVWLLWEFSEVPDAHQFSPTVRPPRLGGNERVGVFASRSPFRPNRLGLSSVRLIGVELTRELGPVLRVAGADLVDGTPIYDVKPYVAYADAHPDARSGFVDAVARHTLTVVMPDEALGAFPLSKLEALREVLALDPRPSYQFDSSRVYGMSFAGFDVRFSVAGDVLTVVGVEKE